MKYGLVIVILFLLTGACNDEIPYDLATPEAGKQKVLIEEISGVRCPNCPDGSRLLEALNEDFDSSLIVVTYHAGSFSVPYDESKYDFKTDQTVALMELLGRPEGYPSAAIQRIPIPDKSTYQRLPNSWTTTVSQAVNSDPLVDLNVSIDTVNNFTNLKISTLFLNEVNTPVYMTAYVTEDGMIDPQADSRYGGEFVNDYLHDHVLREVLTPVTGTKLGNTFQSLAIKEEVLHVEHSSLPNVLNPENASYIVFLHTEEGVLQVEKINF